MKINNAEFIKSCNDSSKYPVYNYPEFAFMGRSNVGKSSLINYLTNRKSLVKTGSTPGVTQMVNFFLINDKLSFVDLPGYGYAKVPIRVKKAFIPMIKNYFKSRENLRVVFMLIDCRRDPGEQEKKIISLLSELEIPTGIILTKTDKLNRNKLNANKFSIAKSLKIEIDWMIETSTLKKTGKHEILSLINNYI